MKTIKCLSIILVTLILLACDTTQSTSQSYQDTADQAVTSQGYPGIIIGVKKINETSKISASGLSEIEKSVEILTTDKFNLASVSKIFTAVALLQLVDEGKVLLDAPVLKYIKGNNLNKIPHIKDITVRQVLNHSSGIYGFNNDKEYLNTLLGPKMDQYSQWDKASLIGLASGERVEPLGLPGTGHYYSDVNSIICGLIIESVTKKSLRASIYDNIIKPLGLKSTGYYGLVNEDSAYSVSPTTNGYLKRSEILDSFIEISPSFNTIGKDLLNTTPAVETIDSAAGMVSSARDLLIFGEALYLGDLVSQSSLDFLLSSGAGLEAKKLNSKGQGVTTVHKKTYGLIYTSLGDGAAGINTMLAFHPESKSVFVAYTNIFGNFNEHDFFMDSLIPELLHK